MEYLHTDSIRSTQYWVHALTALYHWFHTVRLFLTWTTKPMHNRGQRGEDELTESSNPKGCSVHISRKSSTWSLVGYSVL